jgi:hypothetical protein
MTGRFGGADAGGIPDPRAMSDMVEDSLLRG